MAPIKSHETIIHGSDPIRVIPIVFTIYDRTSYIDNRAHRLISLVADYDFFIVGELDTFPVGPLTVLQGTLWIGMMKDKGDDYHLLLDELRTEVFRLIFALFPLVVFPDQDD